MSFRVREALAIGVVICVGLSSAQGTRAQSEEGRWLVTSFAPWELAARGAGHLGPQFFAFQETGNGLLLMGNNFGLVVFDGHRTARIPLPGGRIVLSLDRDAEGNVWAGGTGSFGRLVVGSDGELALERLGLPRELERVAFTDVWSTGAFRWGTMFRAPEAMFWRRPDGSWELFEPHKGFGVGSARIGDRWFVRDAARGLLEFRDGKLISIPGTELFGPERIYALVPRGERELLVATRDLGLFLLDPDAPAGADLRPFSHELGDWPSRALLYCGIRTQQGDYVLGSLQGGLVVMDAEGRLLRRMTQEDGLREDQVLTLFEDSVGQIWVGHGRGVSRIAANSALSRFGIGQEDFMSVEDIARVGGTLLLATNRGVLRLVAGTTARLELVEGSLPSFGLIPVGGEHYVSLTHYGPRLGGRGRIESTIEGVLYGPTPSKEHPGLYLAYGDGGIYGFRVAEGNRVVVHRLLELDTAVSALAEHAGAVWFNTEYQAPYLRRAQWSGAEVAPGFPKLEPPVGVAEGSLVEAWASPLVLGDRLLAAHPGPALVWDGERFVVDRELAAAMGGAATRLGRETVPTEHGSFLVSQENRIWEVRPEGQNGWQAKVVAQLPPSGRILALYREASVLWIGTDEGLFRLDLARTRPAVLRDPMLRAVRTAEGKIVWSAGFREGRNLSPMVLPRGLRAVRLEVAAAGSERPEETEFRIWLEPLEARPTKPVRQPEREVSRLPAGRYDLRIEIDNGGARAQTTLQLVVPRLWYEQPVTYAAGLVLLVLLGRVAYLRHIAALDRRARQLEAEVAQRTEQLREASFTDPLTGARNRRYFTEVVSPDVQLFARAPLKEGLGLFLIDLDHFKKINDSYGHAAGDAILKETAQRLHELLRGSDLLFRWGGEEFLVVARAPAPLGGEQLAERILRALSEKPYALPDETRLVMRTASIGWVPCPFFPEVPRSLSLEQIVELADRALYRAKHEGRARAIGYLPRDSSPEAERTLRAWLDSSAILDPPPVLRVVETLSPRPASAEIVLGEVRSS